VETDVTKILDEFGIKYVIKEHQNPAFACEDVARERNVRLAQVLKCMVGKDINKNVYIMLIPGDKILKIKKLRHITGGIKIDLFSPKDLSDSFNIIVGAISPIQFLKNARFYIDETVLLEDIVDISSGSPNAGVQLKTRDLVNFIKPTLCDIISSNSGIRSLALHKDN